MSSLYRTRARSDLTRQRDVGAAGTAGGSLALSLPVIVGIALGGALIILSVLLVILIRRARKKDRLERQRTAAEIRDREEQLDFKASLKYTQPPELKLPKRLSGNPFTPFSGIADEFVEINLDSPRKAKTANFGSPPKPKSPSKLRYRYSNSSPKPKVKRSSGQGGSFRYSGMRDSWPLVSGIPLSFLPSQSLSTMTLNQVAPPGYIVAPESDSKWLRRSSSKVLKNKVVVSTEEPNDKVKPPSPAKGPKWHRHQRRSNSETQLSSILRSTSQRLKAAHRRSLTRTMSTFARLPGSPPSQRPPTPPFKQQTESREALIDSEISYAESERSSVYESYMRRTPSLGKSSRNSGHVGSKRDRSTSPSGDSDNSLCALGTPDLVIPAPLTSPSKQYARREQRHTMSISKNPKELSLLLRKNSRQSIQPLASRNSMAGVKKAVFASPHRISLSSDPFYSEVKSSKPVFPIAHAQGPRPLYVRKATFGQYATSIRPLSYTSPLRDVSGNAQPVPPIHHSRSASQSTAGTDDSPERNPFQWDPQEAMRIRPRPLSPKRNGSRKKGHRRSNVIRMSNLSRPQSAISVDVVPEEPEDEPSPLRFSIPSGLPFRVMEPTKSPSPSPSTVSRQHSMRPPSTSTFNPSYTSADLRRNSSSKLPKPIAKETQRVQSPTLSVNNYYTEQSGGSEDEFFKSKRSSTTTSLAPSRTTSQRHNRQTSEPRTLISFPPPIITSRSISIPARPLPSMQTIVSPPSLLHLQSPSPAPPLLTMPIPGHLTGPRFPPTRSNSSVSPPPRNSLQASIGLLRRMNSEVSHYSNTSLASDIYSPTSSRSESPELPAHRSFALSPSPRRLNLSSHGNDEDKESDSRGRSRGSQHYLSIGQHESPRHRRNHRAPDRRDSHLLYKEKRRQRKMEELERAVDEPDELTPVREVSSPGSTGLTPGHLPTIDSTSNLTLASSPPKTSSNSPTKSNLSPTKPHLKLDTSNPPPDGLAPPQKRKSVRWSDAMPTAASTSTRRESKMEHPSPRTPPRGLGINFYGGQPGSGPNGERRPGTGDSLGLYDENGFLRSSPVKGNGEESPLKGREHSVGF